MAPYPLCSICTQGPSVFFYVSTTNTNYSITDEESLEIKNHEAKQT